MKGRVVAITGANRGIGAAAAAEFVRAGAQVALLVRDVEQASGLVASLGPQARAFTCDVAQSASVAQAIDGVVGWGGGLDVMVNNAGVIEPIAALHEADPADFAAAIATNLAGVFHGMRAALPVMRAAGRGTILTVSSGAAHNPIEGWGAYCSGKAGALMLTRVAHLENAGHGIRVMGLSPGTVATDMQVVIKASGINEVSRLDPAVHIPAGWPARALVWMCSSDADDWLGQDVKLRDGDIRRRIGLVA